MGTRRRWSRRWTCGAVVAVGALMALASPASAATTVTVTPVFGTALLPGAAVPVSVEVQADHLISGTLDLRQDLPGAQVATVALPVEVPGGSVKHFELLVPTLGTSPIVATLHDRGQVVRGRSAPFDVDNQQELVGLLPGVLNGRPLPGTAPLRVDVGTARFVALHPADLELGPAAVDALGTIGASADELARMESAARGSLLRWIGGGGRLLVDAPPGTHVDGLPPEWQPGSAARHPAGLGEVVLTGDAITAGRWTGLVAPTDRVLRQNGSAMNVVVGGGPTSIGNGVAQDAGLRLAGLGWLIGVLLVYLLLIGPVTFVVLRRRRRVELAWLVLPLTSILFTTGAYGAGRGLRGHAAFGHGSIIETGPGGAVVQTFVGLTSPSGGRPTVSFPRRWSVGGAAPFVFRPDSQTAGVTLTQDGADIRQPLNPGQFGIVTGSGPVDVHGGLAVSATSAGGDEVKGTVRNTTDWTLDDVGVFVGEGGTDVGTLKPGESRPFTLSLTRNFNGLVAPFQVWNEFAGMQMSPKIDGPVSIGLWDQVENTGGPSFRTGGDVVAAGWTRAYTPPVAHAGRRPRGRTLVVSRGSARTGAGTAAILARSQTLRGAVMQLMPGGGFGMNGSDAQTVMRFVLPDPSAADRTVDTARLAIQVPNVGVGIAAEVWVGDRWQSITAGAATDPSSAAGASSSVTTVPAAANGAPPTPATPVPAFGPRIAVNGAMPTQAFRIPPEAVRDGELYVRFANNGPMVKQPGQSPALVEVAS